MIDPKHLEILEYLKANDGLFDDERDALALAIQELRTMGEIEAAFDIRLLGQGTPCAAIWRTREGEVIYRVAGEYETHITNSLADAWESIKEQK